MHLLAERWPGLSSLPYAQLADTPTPVTNARDADVPSVKRDDLTSGLYGGNKVRKLEFLLGAAIEACARSVITFGAYGSNHAVATAVHALELGLEPHVVLSPQPPTSSGAANVLAHAGLGTRIHCVDRYEDAAREAVRIRAELRERDGVESYVIPMGGSSAAGIVGYVNAAEELRRQAAAGDLALPDAVYVPAGTLGTAVGLAIGFAALEMPVRVEAVRVTPEELVNEEYARRLVRETVSLLRAYDAGFPVLDLADLSLVLRGDQYGSGYAEATPQAEEAVEAAEEMGLTLETTYSGKAFAALLADVRACVLSGDHALFWDTYSSGPKPSAGDVSGLPAQLREFVAACDAL